MEASSNILDLVRGSAAYVAQHAKHINIVPEAISEFAKSLDIEKFKEKSGAVNFPLRFSDAEDELNFIAVVDLLNFASGFRKPLHALCGRGAYETICYGCLSLKLSGVEMDAQFMRSVMLTDIAQHFNLPLRMEQPLNLGQNGSSTGSAVTTLVDTPLRPLANMIAKVLNETGKILQEKECKNLAEFVLRTLSSTSTHKAATLTSSLAHTFPAFNDTAVYGSEKKQVFILKKAQLLAGDIHRTLGGKDKLFLMDDYERLTVFTDNVLPAVLRKLGILHLSDSLAQKVDNGELLPAHSEEEIELRVLSIQACEKIIETLREQHKDARELFVPAQLDYYLWTVGKEPEFRACERHATVDTVYY